MCICQIGQAYVLWDKEAERKEFLFQYDFYLPAWIQAWDCKDNLCHFKKSVKDSQHINWWGLHEKLQKADEQRQK